jgi:hypothetical protein
MHKLILVLFLNLSWAGSFFIEENDSLVDAFSFLSNNSIFIDVAPEILWIDSLAETDDKPDSVQIIVYDEFYDTWNGDIAKDYSDYDYPIYATIHTFYSFHINEERVWGCADPSRIWNKENVPGEEYELFFNKHFFEYSDTIRIQLDFLQRQEACNTFRLDSLAYAYPDRGEDLIILGVQYWKNGRVYNTETIMGFWTKREDPYADSWVENYPVEDSLTQLWEGFTYGWRYVPPISLEKRERLLQITRLGMQEHSDMRSIFFSSYHILESLENGSYREVLPTEGSLLSLEDSVAWVLQQYPRRDTILEGFSRWSNERHHEMYPGVDARDFVGTQSEVDITWKSDFTYDFEFLGERVDVLSMPVSKVDIYARISTNTLQIHGSSSTQSPQLFDLQGREYGVSWQYEGEYWQGNMMDIVPGLYIVRVGEQSVLVEYK